MSKHPSDTWYWVFRAVTNRHNCTSKASSPPSTRSSQISASQPGPFSKSQFRSWGEWRLSLCTRRSFRRSNISKQSLHPNRVRLLQVLVWLLNVLPLTACAHSVHVADIGKASTLLCVVEVNARLYIYRLTVNMVS